MFKAMINRHVRNLTLMIAAIGILAQDTSSTQAAAFSIDYVNGIWGVAYTAETQQAARASERATRFGAMESRLTLTTTRATQGFNVVYVIGFCPVTKRWVGCYGFDANPAVAQTKALDQARAAGAPFPMVVKAWFDR
jgi:hypothetical protein